jgi:hypothetical protein
VGDSEEQLDVEGAISCLNDALRLQYRSVHQDQVDFLVRARRRS